MSIFSRLLPGRAALDAQQQEQQRQHALAQRQTAPRSAAADNAYVTLDAQQNELMAQCIANARSMAQAEGRQPNLMDIFTAGMQLRGQAQARGIAWGPEQISQLSGQKLEGFLIDAAHFNPSAEDKSRMCQLLDLDGDQYISDFCAGLNHESNFRGTLWADCTFHPATALEYVCRAEGAQFSNLHLSGMEEGDRIVLGNGQPGEMDFRNVHVAAEGGELVVASNARINKLSIEPGSRVLVNIANNAQVNRLEGMDAELVQFNVGVGGTIAQGKLENSRICEASNLQGAVIRSMEFNGCTIDRLNLRDAHLTEVHIDRHTSMNELDLRGARLSHSSLAGDISGVIVDENTRFHGCFLDGNPIKDLAHFKSMQVACEVGKSLAASLGGALAPDQNNMPGLPGLVGTLAVSDVSEAASVAQTPAASLQQARAEQAGRNEEVYVRGISDYRSGQA